MLRSRKVLVLLLLAVAVPATAQSFGFSIGAASPGACLAIGDTAFRIAHGTRADYTVRMDPTAASPDIRIQLTETADAADFVLVDDGDAPPHCRQGTSGFKNVKIDTAARTPDLVVGFAGSAMPADYRIFVRSRWLEPETAAALYAAAHIRPRLRAAGIATNR